MMCAATSRADRDVVIVFDHIPKCAGTSVDTILQQASCCFYGVHSAFSQVQVARRLNAARHPGVTLLMGHYSFGIHALLSKAYDVRYFTFLRDPFAIARSLYTYNKATQMYLYGSFADFLVEYPFRHMVDFLGGSCRRAIERLQRYCYVGFVETFQDSIRELSARIGVDLDPGVRVNRSQAQTDAQGDFAALREGLTGPDFELYAYFREKYRPEHQTHASYHLDAFYRTDTVTTTLRETKQLDRLREIVQGLDAMSGSQAFMCAKLRLDISDTAFLSLFEQYKDSVNGMVNTNQVDTAARFQTVREILDTLLPYTPQAQKDSQIVLQAQALLHFLAQTPQAQAEGLPEDLFRQALALNPATALVCYGYAIWLRSQGRAREALALLEDSPGQPFFGYIFPGICDNPQYRLPGRPADDGKRPGAGPHMPGLGPGSTAAAVLPGHGQPSPACRLGRAQCPDRAQRAGDRAARSAGQSRPPGRDVYLAPAGRLAEASALRRLRPAVRARRHVRSAGGLSRPRKAPVRRV